MRFTLALTFGGTNQVRLPLGTATGATITITPSIIDGVATSTPAWVPEEATSWGDFADGFSSIGPIEDAWSTDPDYDPSPATYEPGVGLVLGFGGALLTPLLTGTQLTTGFTVVVDVTFPEGGGNFLEQYVQLPDFDYANTFSVIAADPPVPVRVAATFLAGGSARSRDGAAVVTHGVAPGVATDFGLDGTGTITRIAFLDPVDNADLPALSA